MLTLLGYLYDLDYKASRLKHANKRVRKPKPKTKAAVAAAVAPPNSQRLLRIKKESKVDCPSDSFLPTLETSSYLQAMIGNLQ
jgi:hypothetical protein